MCHHDGLGPLGKGGIQTVYINVVGRQGNVYEYRYGTILDDGGNGSGKTCCHGNHLIARFDASFLQLGRG